MHKLKRKTADYSTFQPCPWIDSLLPIMVMVAGALLGIGLITFMVKCV